MGGDGGRPVGTGGCIGGGLGGRDLDVGVGDRACLPDTDGARIGDSGARLLGETEPGAPIGDSIR